MLVYSSYMTHRNVNNALRDLSLIILSVGAAVLLARSGLVAAALDATSGAALLETFVAGMFFTSAFTTAPAIAVLGEIAQRNPIFITAGVGALGSLAGDSIIFRFVRDRLTEDLAALVGKRGRDTLRHIVSRRIFRWFSPFVAALIIASPLPDELGVLILGLTSTRTMRFAIFSYAANFAGILAIAAVSRSLA